MLSAPWPRPPTSREGVNRNFLDAERGPLRGVLRVSREPLVSVDINRSPSSATVDPGLINVAPGNLAKVTAGYDNETGLSHRRPDLAVYLGSR